jgi:hypothetical protein
MLSTKSLIKISFLTSGGKILLFSNKVINKLKRLFLNFIRINFEKN